MTKKSENKPIIVHVSEVLATGILELIYALSTNINDFEHVIVYRIRELGHDEKSIRKLFPDNIRLIAWKNVARPINLIQDFKAGRELKNILKTVQPDIVHLHSSKAGAIGRLVAPSVVDKKAIVYTPNGAPFARNDISKFKRYLFKVCERIADWYSGQVVCVSKSEAALYKNIGIFSTLINNGIQQSQNIKRSKKEKFKIITSGRIIQQKNPAWFNEIALHFENNPAIEFVWIGDGKLKKHLTAKNIKVTGWVSKKEVYQLLSESSLFLSTSLWEGLPFSALEAMSIGLPTVVSDCVGNCDLVEIGKNGYLFNSTQKAVTYIKSIKEDRDLLQQLSHNARQMSQDKFSIQLMISKYHKLYAEILNKKEKIAKYHQ